MYFLFLCFGWLLRVYIYICFAFTSAAPTEELQRPQKPPVRQHRTPQHCGTAFYIPGISPFRVVACTVLVLLRCSSFRFRNRTLPVHVSASQSFVVCVASCFGRRCVTPNCQRLCNNFKAVLDRQLLCLTQETTSRVARLFLSCWPRAAVHPRTLL